KAKPDLSIRLTKFIGFRLRRIESRIEELVYRDVPARLAHLLLEISKEFGQQEANGIRLGIRLTHQEIANLIGSTRETVSATLGEFRRQGLLRLDSRFIILIRLQELAQLTGNRSLSST
ncbi:MAG: Crp/Fnr family transcriptional regulator, partial [Nitrospiria bacterium]